MGDVNHEPTMEEILASIKKIIAEDGEAPIAAPDARSQRTPPAIEDDEPPVAALRHHEHQARDVLEGPGPDEPGREHEHGGDGDERERPKSNSHIKSPIPNP